MSLDVQRPDAATDPAVVAATGPVTAGRRLTAAGVVLVAVVAAVILSLVHLTQGTSGIGASDLIGLAFGSGNEEAARVLVASRLPRMLAGLAVGLALDSRARQSRRWPAIRWPPGHPRGQRRGAPRGDRRRVRPDPARAPRPGFRFRGRARRGRLVIASAGGRRGPTRLILAGSAVAIARWRRSPPCSCCFRTGHHRAFRVGQRLAGADRPQRGQADGARHRRRRGGRPDWTKAGHPGAGRRRSGHGCGVGAPASDDRARGALLAAR